jgi:hypothetical protein
MKKGEFRSNEDEGGWGGEEETKAGPRGFGFFLRFKIACDVILESHAMFCSGWAYLKPYRYSSDNFFSSTPNVPSQKIFHSSGTLAPPIDYSR